MKSVLVRLQEYRLEASTVERSIIAYILENPKQSAALSVHELAARTYASASSIIRLCKKNGFKGYREFSQELIYEMAIRDNSLIIPSGEVTSFDSVEEIIEKITYRNIVSLENTKALLDAEVIGRCIELVRDSSNICLFGMGSSLLVAKDAYHKFTRLNKRCTVNEDWHMQLVTAKNMSASDIGIILSYSGETKEMIECAKALKHNGAACIAITRFGSSPISQLADYNLYVAANEGLVRGGAMSSRISQLNVIDILYSGYVNLQVEITKEKITRTHILKESNVNNS